ncbi:MAG: DEAD/DEAH box helicase [Oligoflexia bacterium]|nr:DEAD/DEAH box helicase [Oligoflexia bacterium]
MPDPHADQERLLTFIKHHAPYSIVDLGMRFAANGGVTDCSRFGNEIHGTVKDDAGSDFSVKLRVISTSNLDASCSCSSHEDLAEQWCQHIVALLVRASDLGFFDSHAGFSSSDSVYRVAANSPAEIATVIRELGGLPVGESSRHNDYRPAVAIMLDLKSDRLGLKVLFDGNPQGPALFDDFDKVSSRALDTILLKLLDDGGNWDEEKHIWYINSSSQIEVILGLIQEYDEILDIELGNKISFSHVVLDARLDIQWNNTGARLEMRWLFPDGNTRTKSEEVLGTGPYWACVDNCIYRLSNSASKIASIFPYASTVSIARSQAGPLLEVLNENLFEPRLINIRNPELQPDTKVKSPTPVLELEKRDGSLEHFASQESFEVIGNLSFEYPSPPEKQNVVYLPDKQKERECIELLKSLGFDYESERKRYLARGDAALEVVYRGLKLFPDHWEIAGLEDVQKSVRFSELALNVSLASVGVGARSKKKLLDQVDCHISLSQNRASVPISALFKTVRSGSDKWIRLDNGAYARVPGGGLFQLKTTLGMLDPNFRLSNTIKTRVSMAQALSFSRLEEDSLNVSVDKQLDELSKKLKDFTKIPPVKLTKHFTGTLRHYQADGLSWLKFLNSFELGGILADEMGLGKTVQTLALLQTLKEERGPTAPKEPAVVVAPTSVITNWLYEARRFTPKLDVLLLHGPDRKRWFGRLEEYDLIITSYALLRLDRHDLEKYQFSYLILDEAQNIKNHQAAVTKAAKAIRAAHRLALSGTPTENRPMELWSIMDFLMPGYLGSNDFFRNYIEKPILEAGPDVQIAKFLNSKTRPFILRRTKAEVEKDLPPKTESVLHVDMTDSQRLLYAQVLEEVRPKVFAAIEQRGVRGASVSILAALLRLRQICNHPNSIDALKDLPGFDSGKFSLLRELVEEALQSGRKILLFSQFKEMLNIIRRWLDEVQANYLYLDGTTRDRQSLVDRFNHDEKVRLFLISLKAGGTGLNLTGADTVIIYDPWWNPAVEHQAVDRAHRIGQTKPVTVYRLVTENSIEQKIMDLKAKKAKIVDALINENGLSTVSLSKADLESLFAPMPE